MPRRMTQQGYEAIQKELESLWHVERPEIVEQVSAAAELGDRSENAAYIYGKRKLRHIDSRMRYLRRKIEGVQVVRLEDLPAKDQVDFGAVVTVEDEDGAQKTWRLVDKEESEPRRGWISVQSPIGRALLGGKVGDWIDVELPRGEVGYEILSVRYGGGEP